MMEIQLQKRLQIFLLNKICQSKTHGLFTMIERTKHGGHITDVDGNIKAFPDY